MCLAALYTLTPLTVAVIVAAAAVLPRFGRGLPRGERRWLTALVVLALAARLAAIGGLFLRNLPDHDDLFAGATNGDEAYSMSRALRAREILRGSSASVYDYYVAFDDYGRNSFVTMATALQLAAGPTPYSLRLFNTLVFTCGALLLFRVSRRAFGAAAAMTGLVAVLFWPSLFAWSISLLKEALYFFLNAAIVAAAVTLVRTRSWQTRTLALAGGVAAAGLVQGLRPGALGLAAAGLISGFAASALFASKRAFAIGAIAAALIVAAAVSRPPLNARLLRALEGTAKTHTGHVFTVGHDYKLLDAGFYVNPQAPAASTLTLTGGQAGRYVIRAAGSFLLVPAPWQLQSARELVYLPEQLAWYVLVLLLPIGAIAGYRRDPLVTCLLAGYTIPTAIALALTNGNVGTLLRLRGLVIPFLAWTSAVGFCATINIPGRKDTMAWIDNDGRLLGRVNLFDAAIGGFALLLVPIAYGTFLLFRTPAPRIDAVTRVPITQEERRVAGSHRVTAKLKVRGSGFRPMLQASIGHTRALGFVFENPNSADVIVGAVPPGTHDLILSDGVQELARLPRSVTIESAAPALIAGLGVLLHMDQVVADALTPVAASAAAAPNAIVALGDVRTEPTGRKQRAAEILLQCDPDPDDEGCTVGGVRVNAAPWPSVKITAPSGVPLSFALTEVLPASAPAPAVARIRIAAAPEILAQVRTGDRDESLDARAAVVTGVTRRQNGASDLDVTVRLGVDESAEGLRYRGRPIKAGAPFWLTTARYVVTGTVLEVSPAPQGVSK